MSTEDLITGLREWTRRHDPHVRAAVELLIDHDGGMWLHRGEFVTAFVTRHESGETTIDFAALADAIKTGTGVPGASSTEMGILRLAADLGTDRWRISRMDDETVHLVRVAMATATE